VEPGDLAVGGREGARRREAAAPDGQAAAEPEETVREGVETAYL